MKRTIFSERYDYLLAVAALTLTFWAFYDMKAAVGGGIVLVAIANLQPIQRLGFSRNTATLLGASLLLILSIGLKIIDLTGYCYAFFGPQRQGIDIANIRMPCFADNDFYSDLTQPGGMGFIRDLGLPIGGLALGLLTLSLSGKLRSIIAAVLIILTAPPPIIHLVFGDAIKAQRARAASHAKEELDNLVKSMNN